MKQIVVLVLMVLCFPCVLLALCVAFSDSMIWDSEEGYPVVKNNNILEGNE